MSDKERLADLHYELRQWEALIETPEWGKLVGMLQEQADGLQRAILFSPLAGADSVYQQEFMKGQLEGRLSISNTVETLMETLKVDIETLQRGMKDE